MMRLTRINQTRVSNRTAVLAACLLFAATAASVGGALDSGADGAPSLVGTSMTDDSTPATTVRSAKANKGFKVSLYLFRRN